jgi:hypothetical protein
LVLPLEGGSALPECQSDECSSRMVSAGSPDE